MDAQHNEALEVHRESPRQAEVARLIEAADAYAATLYPAESNHLMNVDALSAPEVLLFAARVGGIVVGCGAVTSGSRDTVRSSECMSFLRPGAARSVAGYCCG
jgi:hypothetical protein